MIACVQHKCHCDAHASNAMHGQKDHLRVAAEQSRRRGALNQHRCPGRAVMWNAVFVSALTAPRAWSANIALCKVNRLKESIRSNG